MIYGYARCSTNESKQDINRQVRELKAAGAEQIFLEYEHGDSKIKSQQRAMLEQAQAGDSIITLEVPRLARSTQQLCEIIDTVSAKHLRLQIIGSITLDCRNGQADPMSEAFLQMAGVFSQLELSMIRARVRSGMANAKAKHRLTMVNTPLNRALGVRNQIFHSNDTRSAVAWTWERMMSATCRRSSKSMLSQFPRWEDKYSIFCGETLSAFSAAISFISP